MKLIDKDALVAEIDKEIKCIYAGREYVGISLDEENRVYGLQISKDIIDTLEVKEIQEKPISEELEVEVDKWYNNEAPKEFENVLYTDIEKCAKHFANWQKQQDQSTIELAEDHAMFAGMEKMKEELMAKAKGGTVQKDYQIIMDDGTYIDLDPSMSLKPSLAVKEGERIKVIIVKED